MHMNASLNTCDSVPVCTDINGGSLKKLHLVCGCSAVLDDDDMQFGLSVQLSVAQKLGIAVLMVFSTVLVLVLLKKCCSATLFLR
jgi:hypothetical protein